MRSPLRPLIRVYLQEKVAAGEFAKTTVPSVRCNLHAFCTSLGPLPVAQLRAEHVEEWLGSNPGAKATMRHRFTHVRGFSRWLVRRGYLKTDPTCDMKPPKQPRPVPRGLGADDIGRLLGACPDSRARLMVLLGTQEGFRAIEISRVELGDIDFGDRSLRVRGKGGFERLLPISRQTWHALSVYLVECPARAGPLIRNQTDTWAGISPNHISKLMTRWMRSAGVDGSGHALRHTMASNLLRDGADIRDVQQALGHVSLTSTSVYLPFSDVNRLRQVMGGRWYGSAPDAA